MAKANWKNKTVFTGDNLPVLRGMNSASVDLIYLDPPFNSNKTYSAPIGSEAAGAVFKDTWTLSDVDEEEHGMLADTHPALYKTIDAARHSHGQGMMSYLIMMSSRLLELNRLLKETGSIYLHCDPTAGHYLKLLMDSVFGNENFRNEIIWCYRGAGYPKNDFGKRHDTIYRYSKTKAYTFNLDAVREDYAETTKARFKHYIGNKRKSGDFGIQTLNPLGKHPDDWWQIQPLAPSAKERTGYPTQKPLALLDKIIKAGSHAGDMILDPFCGCATTLVSAELSGRQWTGIDISELTVKLVKKRIKEKQGVLLRDMTDRDDIPKRTDQGQVKHYRHKDNKHFLYGRQMGDCNGCGIHFPFKNMAVDHQLPVTKSGGDELSHLQLLCGYCNSVKGDGTMAELKVKLKKMGYLDSAL